MHPDKRLLIIERVRSKKKYSCGEPLYWILMGKCPQILNSVMTRIRAGGFSGICGRQKKKQNKKMSRTTHPDTLETVV